jgi:hypothetical protein
MWWATPTASTMSDQARQTDLPQTDWPLVTATPLVTVRLQTDSRPQVMQQMDWPWMVLRQMHQMDCRRLGQTATVTTVQERPVRQMGLARHPQTGWTLAAWATLAQRGWQMDWRCPPDA